MTGRGPCAGISAEVAPGAIREGLLPGVADQPDPGIRVGWDDLSNLRQADALELGGEVATGCE
jgi:hypothetical protein